MDLKSTKLYKVERYNSNCYRIIEYNCSVFGSKEKHLILDQDKKDNGIDKEHLKQSISRSKRNIRRLCLSNEFQYFCTWTINSNFADRFSVQQAQEKMRELLKEYQRRSMAYKKSLKNERDRSRYETFKYIYVIEKHKNGALHFHGMVKNMLPGDLELFDRNNFDKLPYYILDSIDKNKKLYYSNFFNDKLGYCTFSKINNYNACCNYMIKYISKDPVRNENDQIYFCSRDLSKGSDKIFSAFDLDFFDNCYEYKENDNLICRVKDIYLDNFNTDTKNRFLNFVINDNYLVW